MAQQIKPASIWGRLGSGIGRGLAEQLPEEIQRGRLSAGLQQLSQTEGLSPFQQFAGLSSLPGATPQMIQSGTELLKQQARAQALSERNRVQTPAPSPFPPRQPSPAGSSNIPSITQEGPLSKIQEGYIPPTIEERDLIAGDAYNANPAFFANDPQKAIDWANQKIAQEEKIATAYQAKHANLNAIQDNVVSRLKAQSERLKTNVPADLYSKIEDEAIQATKSKKEGGRGLTEQQAMKEYGDKLNDASRLFEKVREVGNWGITLRPSSSTLRSLKEIQKDMDDLGETDNFAKTLIAENKLSPKMAYGIAEPVNKVSSLNKFIRDLPEVISPLANVGALSAALGSPTASMTSKSPEAPVKTLQIAPQLAKFVEQNSKASPLAIAYELEKKGYDAETWLNYLVNQNLNLKTRQSEQVSTPINVATPWNDWWLSSFSGLE